MLGSVLARVPVPIMLVDDDMRFTGANEAAAALTGYSLAELESCTLATLIMPSGRDRLPRMWNDFLRDGQASGEWRLVRKDGTLVAISYEAAANVVPGEHMAVLRDITDQNQAKEGRARLAAVAESSYDAIIALTLDGTITSWNAAAQRIFGYATDEIIGQNFSLVVPREIHDDLDDILRRVSRGQMGDRVATIRHKDGSALSVSVSISPVRDGTGTIVSAAAIGRDMRAGERANEERQRLLARLVAAHVEERVRIARELHDSLGQLLTSAALFAGSMEQQIGGDVAASAGIVRDLVERALAATRTLVWHLRPIEVDHLGLVGAIDRLADETRARSGINVDTHLNGLDARLDASIEGAAFRVVQEAVTNAVNHAAPKSVSVLTSRTGSELTVVIEDDGGGFDPAAALDTAHAVPHAGLLGMRERAELCGGHLAVDSALGRGTTIRFVVPVPEPS